MAGPWLNAAEDSAFFAEFAVAHGDLLLVKLSDDAGEPQGSGIMVITDSVPGLFATEYLVGHLFRIGDEAYRWWYNDCGKDTQSLYHR